MKNNLRQGIRRYITLMLAAVLVLSSSLFMSACDETRPPDSESGSSTEEATSKPDTPKTELTIYTDDTTYDVFNELTAYYNRFNANVVYNVVKIDDSDKLDSRLNRELAAGKGPDIIIVSENTNLNLPMLIKNGAIADIDQLIADSSKTSFSLERFDGDILKAGEFGGKQLLIPLFYTLPIIVGVDEYLKDADAKLDGTFTEFCDSLESYKGTVFRYMPSVSSLYLSLGYDFIDLNSGKCELDDQRMRELISSYVKMYDELVTDPSKYQVSDKGTDDYNSVGLTGEDFLFLNSAFSGSESNISSVSSTSIAIRDAFLSAGVYALPGCMDDGTVSASLGWSIAVSSSCKDNKAALDYINYITAYDMTSVWTMFGISSYEAYNRNVREKTYGQEVILPDNVFLDEFYYNINSDVDKEILDRYYAIFDAKDGCGYLDANVKGYLDTIAVEILKDGLSVDEAIKNAETRILEYFSGK